VLPDGFLAVDGILNIVANVVDGIQIWPLVILKHVMAELPFMATENILMECVKVRNLCVCAAATSTLLRTPFLSYLSHSLPSNLQEGGDRQDLHEVIREHSMEAGRRVKMEGADNDLLSRIAADAKFKPVHAKLESLTDPSKFVGRAPAQVDEFITNEVDPVLKKHAGLLEGNVLSELKV
jgi:adenylosuccinate lyase